MSEIGLILALGCALISGGLALLAIPARRWFGIAVGARDLIGLGLCAAGLSFLVLTAGHGHEDGTFAGPVVLRLGGGAPALVRAPMPAPAHRPLLSRGWVLLAVAA